MQARTRNRSASRSRWHATRTGMRPMNSGSSPWRTCGEMGVVVSTCMQTDPMNSGSSPWRTCGERGAVVSTCMQAESARGDAPD